MASAKQVYNELSVLVMEYKSAVGRGTGISAAKDRLKNILFSHQEIILSTLMAATVKEKKEQTLAQKEREIEKRFQDQVKALNSELETVDDENMAMRRKIRSLEAQLLETEKKLDALKLKETNMQTPTSIAPISEAAPAAKKRKPRTKKAAENKVMTAVVE